MTVAIKRSNGDLIWLDAVLQFSQQYQGSVTTHPIETGGYVTDHIVNENVKLRIDGVLSDVDFNLNRPVITASMQELFDIKTKQFVNNVPVDDKSVQINTGTINRFAKLLPESVTQFMDEQAPEVIVSPNARPIQALYVIEYLKQMWRDKELFEVLELTVDNSLNITYKDCVITSLSFTEDPDGGAAVYPQLEIEQVVFAESKNVKIPKQVADAVKKKAASKEGQGRKNPETEAKASEDGDKTTSKQELSTSTLSTLMSDGKVNRSRATEQ